jgi:hypothetical protein
MTQEELQHFFTYDTLSGNLIWNYQPDKPKFWNGRMAGKVMGGKSMGTTICNRGQIDGVKYMINHLVWVYHHGDLPEGSVVLNTDGDLMNSRIENLELSTRSACQSSRNGHGKMAGKGVYRHGNKYKAEIKLQGAPVYLGLYRTIEEAQDAYDMTLYQARGDSAVLNSDIVKDLF